MQMRNAYILRRVYLLAVHVMRRKRSPLTLSSGLCEPGCAFKRTWRDISAVTLLLHEADRAVITNKLLSHSSCSAITGAVKSSADDIG